jgi:hypothetical protein
MFRPTMGFTGDYNNKKARDKLLAMIFLAGANKKMYGRLLKDLNNAYLVKKNNCPKSMESTLTLLTHYQDGSNGKTVDRNNEQLARSFAQKKLNKVRCYLYRTMAIIKRTAQIASYRTFKEEKIKTKMNKVSQRQNHRERRLGSSM